MATQTDIFRPMMRRDLLFALAGQLRLYSELSGDLVPDYDMRSQFTCRGFGRSVAQLAEVEAVEQGFTAA